MRIVLCVALLYFTSSFGNVRDRITQPVDKVCSRYYLIARLDHAVGFLSDLHKKMRISARKKAQLFSFPNLPPLESSPVIDVAHKVQVRQSLGPLLREWSACCDYKHIGDLHYERDLTLLITALLTNMGSKKKLSLPPSTYQKLVRAVRRSVRAIGAYIQDRKALHASMRMCSPHTRPTLPVDVVSAVCPDCVMHRFYLIHRLDSFIRSGLFAATRNKRAQLHSSADGDTIVFEQVKFSHRRVQECIREAIRTQRVSSLDQLLSDLIEYKHIQDDAFEIEAVRCICAFYWCVMRTNMRKSRPSNTALTSEMHGMYTDLATLPLEGLLQLVDLFVDHAPTFLEKVDFFSSMGWGAWIKRYWWTLFLLGGLGGYRIYKLMHGSSFLPQVNGFDGWGSNEPIGLTHHAPNMNVPSTYESGAHVNQFEEGNRPDLYLGDNVSFDFGQRGARIRGEGRMSRGISRHIPGGHKRTFIDDEWINCDHCYRCRHCYECHNWRPPVQRMREESYRAAHCSMSGGRRREEREYERQRGSLSDDGEF